MTEYKTQIGIFTNGQENPCGVILEVDAFDYNQGDSQCKFEIKDKDGNSMGAVLIGQREMKRIVMQLLMSL